MTVIDIAPGLTRQAVEQLSAAKGEPDWMRERRLLAWKAYESLPLPARTDEEWRRTDISKLKLDQLVPFAPASGSEVASPLRLNGNISGLITHQNSSTV